MTPADSLSQITTMYIPVIVIRGLCNQKCVFNKQYYTWSMYQTISEIGRG